MKKLTRSQKKELLFKQHEKWVGSGKQLTSWKCKFCNKDNECMQPDESDTGSKGYWDSGKECYECGALSFVAVWPSGNTVSQLLSAPKRTNTVSN